MRRTVILSSVVLSVLAISANSAFAIIPPLQSGTAQMRETFTSDITFVQNAA